MTAREARNVSEKVKAKKVQKSKAKKWNIWDTLQLAWYEMWIKYHAKRGKMYYVSLFTARQLVIGVLEEKKGFKVSGLGTPGCVIDW